MAKQQSRRRRKRYLPGSAYAGDVKPTGVMGFLGSGRTMRIVFLVMALALVGGGMGTVFGFNFGGGSSKPQTNNDFVLPPDKTTPTAEAVATAELKHYSGPPALSIDPTKHYVATIKTSKGDIQVELQAGQTPQTVNNFVFLANDGFYNGLTFYRVDEAFAARTGDPACTPNSTFCRGDGGPGYDIGQERPGAFQVGTLGMANGSQFFIALTDSSQFAQFTPFGRVIAGLDVAEKLTPGTEIKSIDISQS